MINYLQEFEMNPQVRAELIEYVQSTRLKDFLIITEPISRQINEKYSMNEGPKNREINEKYSMNVELIPTEANETHFINAEMISRDIDEKLLALFTNNCLIDQRNPEKSQNQLVTTVNSIINEYSSTFQSCEAKYNTNKTHSLPDIDSVLCLFLREFLTIYPTSGFQDYFSDFHIRNKYNAVCLSMLSKLKQISKYPSDIQYIYAELFRSISQPFALKYMMDFLLLKINENLVYNKIKSEWAQDFINIACRPPFKNILKEFRPNAKRKLRNILEEVTPNIMLIKFPKKIYGFTLKSQRIAIKMFNEIRGEKGATFIIYLHELAHFLQRTECNTIEEAIKHTSPNRGFGSEGGSALIIKIFGEELKLISYSAAEYIVNGSLPNDLLQFQNEFKAHMSKVEEGYISLTKFSDQGIHFGICASFYVD